MRLDDLRRSRNIEDRRGGGGGGFGGPVMIGGGGLGLVAVVVISMLLGVDPAVILNGAAQMQGGQVRQGPPSGPRADDALVDFSAAVLGSTEDVWGELFAAEGGRYRPAVFVPYDGVTPTACGTGQAAMGPFYCPADQRVYVDLSFYRELKERFGAPGDFAQAYVLAHEVGHHVQHLLGATARVQNARGERERNRMSVRLELQADCYAGVWAARAHAARAILEDGDVEEGLAAAAAVGDDALQRKAQGRVVPDAFTHGTSAQRVRWFRTGLQSGDPSRCDTFSVAENRL